LIGRSLRNAIDLSQIKERTIQIDCDVIQADGGTRTASITGAYVAVHDAIKHLMDKKLISESPLIDYVAAISVGLHEGNPLLDLDYSEDSSCDTDMNIVMTGSGGFVEIQGTAEGAPFSREMMDQMSELAAQGIKELIQLQKNVLK
jgi:ribonuclease PH